MLHIYKIPVRRSYTIVALSKVFLSIHNQQKQKQKKKPLFVLYLVVMRLTNNFMKNGYIFVIHVYSLG